MGTLALMDAWEIEDQLAPLVAQETKGTLEKTGNPVQMAPLVQLELLGREESWACRGSVESGACPACQDQQAHQEK